MHKRVVVEISLENLANQYEIHKYIHDAVSEAMSIYVSDFSLDENWQYEIDTRDGNNSLYSEFESGYTWEQSKYEE